MFRACAGMTQLLLHIFSHQIFFFFKALFHLTARTSGKSANVHTILMYFLFIIFMQNCSTEFAKWANLQKQSKGLQVYKSKTRQEESEYYKTALTIFKHQISPGFSGCSACSATNREDLIWPVRRVRFWLRAPKHLVELRSSKTRCCFSPNPARPADSTHRAAHCTRRHKTSITPAPF